MHASWDVYWEILETSDEVCDKIVRRNGCFSLFQDAEFCMVLAFSLQYLRLCVFCWMSVMAHHMYSQFSRNVYLNPLAETGIAKKFLQ